MTIQLLVTNWQMGSQKTGWLWVTEHLAQQGNIQLRVTLSRAGGETDLAGIWAGNTALFIDGKLFARLRALWGPLKMFGKAQSQKLMCAEKKNLWASEN